uniref:Uncharacterized protein n=1 Tax=Trichobilharzia regenti TaxID=157069 RepID=A0AA85JMT8_TRIRE|nr:unnamed protein product [Trichobilharzia regenti]
MTTLTGRTGECLLPGDFLPITHDYSININPAVVQDAEHFATSVSDSEFIGDQRSELSDVQNDCFIKANVMHSPSDIWNEKQLNKASFLESTCTKLNFDTN